MQLFSDSMTFIECQYYSPCPGRICEIALYTLSCQECFRKYSKISRSCWYSQRCLQSHWSTRCLLCHQDCLKEMSTPRAIFVHCVSAFRCFNTTECLIPAGHWARLPLVNWWWLRWRCWRGRERGWRGGPSCPGCRPRGWERRPSWPRRTGPKVGSRWWRNGWPFSPCTAETRPRCSCPSPEASSTSPSSEEEALSPVNNEIHKYVNDGRVVSRAVGRLTNWWRYSQMNWDDWE